jgi:hypothetical protein
MALGNGIANNILATNFYQGQTVGIGAGVGVGTGFLTGLVGPLVGSMIYQSMVSRNITGTQSLNTAMAIGSAVATHLSLGIVTTTSTPVAAGTGFGKLQGIIGPAMGSMILGMMTAQGLIGTQTLNLAMAIGDGVANAINTFGIITTIIVGVPVSIPPVPTAGVEFGKML